jgi:hypothetical protein
MTDTSFYQAPSIQTGSDTNGSPAPPTSPPSPSCPTGFIRKSSGDTVRLAARAAKRSPKRLRHPQKTLSPHQKTTHCPTKMSSPLWIQKHASQRDIEKASSLSSSASYSLKTVGRSSPSTPTFKDLIDDGLPILPGTRFHAERRVGSLIARCYANPSVAVRLLDLFRYCYFPQRRTRKEEEAINAWVRSLATQNYKKQNRAYDSSAPDYADPLAWRYWHNLQHRKNSFPRLIYSICTRRMAPYGLTIQDLLFILYSLFRSGLVYVLCVSFCMRHAISITEYSGKGWEGLRGKLQEVVWEKVCAPWEENFLVYEDEIVEEEPISDPPAPSATPLSTYDLQNDPSEYDALWEFNQKQLAKKAVGYTPTPEEVSAAMTAFKGTPAGSRLTPGALRTAVFAKLRAAFWLRERKKTQSKRKNHGYQSRPTRRIRGSATEAEIRQQEMEEAARLKRRRGGGSKKEITRSLG